MFVYLQRFVRYERPDGVIFGGQYFMKEYRMPIAPFIGLIVQPDSGTFDDEADVKEIVVDRLGNVILVVDSIEYVPENASLFDDLEEWEYSFETNTKGWFKEYTLYEPLPPEGATSDPS